MAEQVILPKKTVEVTSGVGGHTQSLSSNTDSSSGGHTHSFEYVYSADDKPTGYFHMYTYLKMKKENELFQGEK